MTTSFELRDAQQDDVPALVEFLVKLDAHVAGVEAEVLALTDVGKQQLQDRIESFIDESGKRIVVAADPAGSLVGMGDIHIWHYSDAWLNPERQGLRAAFIDDIWVEPEARGSGLAKRIVAKLIDYAERQGVDELNLEYALHNREAQAFWSRLGFKPTGVRTSGWLTDVRRHLRETTAKTGHRKARKKSERK